MAVPALPIHSDRLLLRPFVEDDLEVGFEELGLHHIIAQADPRNLGSMGVMEPLGMRREGHFHHNELIRGAWSDKVLYALLEEEWRARSQPC